MTRWLTVAMPAAILAACVNPPDPDPEPADPDLASPSQIDGVANFAKVTDGVWRGRQPTAEGFRTLKAMGAKTIVNLRAIHSDRDDLRGLGLRYVHIHSTALYAQDEDIAKFLKAATDPANRPVFVHCEHGADRTGVCVAAYRVVVQGWAMEKAKRELPRFGFHEIHVALQRYLDGFSADRMRERMEKETVEVEEVP